MRIQASVGIRVKTGKQWQPQNRWAGRGNATAMLLMSALLCSTVAARAADKIPFQIPGGPARDMLAKFQQQAHLQVLFDYDSVADIATNPVSDELEPRAAIAQMLRGTRLTFEFSDRARGETVIVRLGEPSPQNVDSPEGPPAATAGTKGTRDGNQRRRGGNTLRPEHAEVLEQITVLGTHIRSSDPVGAIPTAYDLTEIEQSGAATVAEFLQTIPGNFGGGPTEDTHNGAEAASNAGFGVGINLRALGSRATLVLLNGRRPAPSGSDGAFTDISVIPLVAIKRIDVLTDGASAVYGSDAAGGVINIVTRDSCPGAESRVQSGAVTEGGMREQRIGQLWGESWESGNGALGIEYYHHDALAAKDRWLAQSDLSPFGGPNLSSIFANPGTINPDLGGTFWAIPSGQDGRSLKRSDLKLGPPNLQNQYLDAQILPAQRRVSITAAAREKFSDSVTVFGDALWSERHASEQASGQGGALVVPSSNPFYVNPLDDTNPVLVYYNFLDDLGPVTTFARVRTLNLGAGIQVSARHDWQIGAAVSNATESLNQTRTGGVNYSALDVALADSNPSTAFNPFGDGSHTNPDTLASIRSQSWFQMRSAVRGVNINADGPVVHLPAGPLKGAVGLEFRQQSFETSESASELYPITHSVLGRRLWAIFAEATAPIVASRNTFTGLRKLELSIATRHERYSDSGSTTTPKYGVVYSPAEGVEIGGTLARSSRPPNLGDLDESRNVSFIQTILDPTSPIGTTTALILSGKNSRLRDERAVNWTLSARLSPTWLPELKIGITYFNINFTDRIQGFKLSGDILSKPIYSSIVTRNPSASLRDQICSNTFFYQGDLATCRGLPIGAVVDLRTRNIDTLQTQGIDFSGSYAINSLVGKFLFNVKGTYILNYVTTSVPDGKLSLLNTTGNPINLRLHDSVTWSRRNLGLTLASNHTSSYRDTVFVPNRQINPWTTVDLQLRFGFGEEGSWLKHTEFALTAKNVLDTNPPFAPNAAAGLGYDPENADLTNRIISVTIAKRW